MDVLVQLMAETLLHTGSEHPSTLWIAVGAVVSFVLGVGVGVYGGDLKNPLSDDARDEK